MVRSGRPYYLSDPTDNTDKFSKKRKCLAIRINDYKLWINTFEKKMISLSNVCQLYAKNNANYIVYMQ